MPYLLSMAAVFVMLKAEGVTGSQAKWGQDHGFIGTVYRPLRALRCRLRSMMYGALTTFAGWFFYGLAAEKLFKHNHKSNVTLSAAADD